MIRFMVILCVLFSILSQDVNAQCQERHGWVKPGAYPAMVTRAPDPKYTIVGIVRDRAAVSVCDSIQGWVKLMDPAPVRDSKGAFIDCKPGCYMRGEHFSTTSPGK